MVAVDGEDISNFEPLGPFSAVYQPSIAANSIAVCICFIAIMQVPYCTSTFYSFLSSRIQLPERAQSKLLENNFATMERTGNSDKYRKFVPSSISAKSADKLQGIPVSLVRNPKMSITGFLLNDDREARSAISSNQSDKSARNVHTQTSVPLGFVTPPPSGISIGHNRLVRIAPRPESIYIPPKARNHIDARKEARKIRKRQAADRCYRRKVAKKKAISSQH